MAIGCKGFSCSGALVLVIAFEVLILIPAVRSNLPTMNSSMTFGSPTAQQDPERSSNLQNCDNCTNRKNVEVTAMYTDASGAIKVHRINTTGLSASWVWSDDGENHAQSNGDQENVTSYQQPEKQIKDIDQPSKDKPGKPKLATPAVLKRRELRKERKKKRTVELIQLSKEAELQLEIAAIEHSKKFNFSNREHYSIWRREYRDSKSDFILKLMKDQIIMAKLYSSLATSNVSDLKELLRNCIRENQRAIGEASSDAELQPRARNRMKAMANALIMARHQLYDCPIMMRKLRARLQYTEENIDALTRQRNFLLEFATRSVPKPLHCLPLLLTTDFFLHGQAGTGSLDMNKLEDNSLYHYAIFSDNVLATSVAVKSAALHAKEPEKHVFHIVTNRMTFAAMKMWFTVHYPSKVTINVENIDDFKWLNSSYSPVLRQLESTGMREYYFKAKHQHSLSSWEKNLKYRNPKYLSILNHLRFYMPEIYPKLDKILFLDDDVVVQEDLTPIWSIDLKGMVNGAVETCKGTFHRLDTYVNFSNSEISTNFDPQYCAWAFGMNIFDLKEWKKQDVTGTYHHWQALNYDRRLWQLGSLPPALLTFYRLTYPIDRRWHLLALGYDDKISISDIEKAAVIHYNGNYKPWLDLAIPKFKKYWFRFVDLDNPYFRLCNIGG